MIAIHTYIHTTSASLLFDEIPSVIALLATEDFPVLALMALLAFDDAAYLHHVYMHVYIYVYIYI
jgi:hypothetical protein